MANIGSLLIHIGVDTSGVLTAETTIRKLGKVAETTATQATAAMTLFSKQTMNTMNATAQKIRTVGYLTSAVITAPIIGAGKAVLTATKDFEFSMQKIVGLVGVAQNTVNDWNTSLLDMAPRLAKSPKELAEALYFITSSGIQGAQALDVLEVSAKAATAGLGETQAVADLLTSVLNAYAGTGITAAKAVDILVAAVREGKGEADAYARTLGQLVPIAANLGVSFDQVAGGLAAMTLTGSSAANAAVYLKGVFNTLMTANDQGAKVLDRLGTSYEELRNILKSGPTGLIDLMQKLRDIQMQYGDEAVKDVLPNIRALTGFMSIAGKNFKYNTEMMKSVTDSAGSLGAAFAAVENILKVRMDRALAEVQISLLKLGQSVAPMIVDALEWLVKKLKDLTAWWENLTESQKRFRVIAVAVAAAIGPITLVLSALIYAITGVMGALNGLWKVIKTIGSFAIAVKGGETALAGFFGTMKMGAYSSAAWASALFSPYFPLIAALVAAYTWAVRSIKNMIAELNKPLPTEAIDEYVDKVINIRDESSKSIEKRMPFLAKMDQYQLEALQNDINTRIQLEKDLQLELMSVRSEGLKDDEKVISLRKNLFDLEQKLYEKRQSLKVFKPGSEDTEPYKRIEQEAVDIQKSIDDINTAIQEHKVEQKGWVNRQLEAIPKLINLYKTYGTQVKSELEKIYGDTQTIENMYKAIKEYNESLEEIISDYKDQLAYLDYMAKNAHKLGIEFDYVGEKSKLLEDKLKDLLKIGAVEDPFTQKVLDQIEKMPANLYLIEKAFKDLSDKFKFFEEKAKIDIEFDVHAEKIKELESIQDQLLEFKITAKNLDKTMIPLAAGITGAFTMAIPAIDLVNLKIDAVTKALQEEKIAQQDAIDTRTLALLDAEASAFKTIGARIDVFTYQLEAARRRLRQLQQQQMDPKAEIIPKGVIDKAVDNIQRLEIALQLLKHQADITHLENLYREIGTADIGMNLLSAHINEVEDALRYLSDQNRGSSKEFEILADRLFALKNAETVVDTLSGAFDEFFDAVIDGSENLGEVMGRIFKQIMVDTIKMLAKLLIVKTIMATLFPAQSAAKTAISVGQMLGIGLKEGGVVPQGYPNDTFPARLSSGEIVIPKDKYKDIDPLRQLAEKGRINASEFFDMPAEYMKTLQIPKLQKGGVIPPGYPNDTYPAFLSSGETVLPAWYTGLLANYKQKPAWEGDVIKSVDTIGQRLHNFFSDLATGILSWGTQLRKPSPVELLKGRGDWGGRAELLGKGATWGMADMITGEVTSKVVPAVVNKVSNISKLISPVGKAETVTSIPEIQKITKDLSHKLEAIEIGNEWSKDWWTHPITQEKIKQSLFDEYEALLDFRKVNSRYLLPDISEMPDDQFKQLFSRWDIISNNIESGLYKSRMALPDEIEILNDHMASGLWSSKLQGPIQSIVHPDLEIPELVTTAIHEGSHGLTWGDKYLPFNIKDDLQSILFTLDDYNKYIENIPPLKVKKASEAFDYLRKPTEIYARLMELRKSENLNPGKLITESHAKNMISLGKDYFRYPIDPVFFKIMKSPKALADIMNKIPAIGGAGLGIGASLFGGEEAKAGEIPQNYLDKLLTYNDILKQTTPLLQAKTAATQADALAMELNTNAASSNAEAMRSIQSVVKGMLDTEKISDIAVTATAGISNLELGTGVNPNELIPTNNTGTLAKQGSALSAAVALAVQSGIALLVTNISDSLTKDIRPAEGVDSSKGFAPIFNVLMGLTGLLVGGAVGTALGGLFKGVGGSGGGFLLGMLFGRNKMMKGGIVPPGYPNDTYPAWLTSGEIVLPNSYRDLDIERLMNRGSLPTGNINDEFQLLLSTYEKLAPEQAAKEKVTNKVYNYNNVTEKIMKMPRVKALNKLTTPKFPKEIKISDKYLKKLTSIAKVGKPPIAPVRIPKIRTPRDMGVKIPKIRTMKDVAPKVMKIKVPKIVAPKMPSVKIPKIAAPRIPKIAIPKFTAPKIPKIAAPKIGTPKIPQIKLPKIASLSRVAKLSRTGALPKTYMRDTQLSRLSSKDKLLPSTRMDHLEPAQNNIHITLEGKIKNRDIALMIRRMKNWN